MILLVFLLLFFRLADGSPVSGGKDVGKVKNYSKKIFVVVNHGTFGYMVYLSIMKPVKVAQQIKSEEMNCGGVIITSDVVLTAAHCIGANVVDAKIVAWAGIVDLKKQTTEGQRIEVKKYKIHEEYSLKNDPVFHANDIALLWLKQSVDINSPFIKIAKLPKKRFNPNNKYGSVVGWGLNGCGERSSMLQKATTKGIRKFDCQLYYPTTLLNEKVICALSDDRRAASSFGDSGGPFVVNDTIVGITSFGSTWHKIGKDGRNVEVCDPKKPVVYTDVSQYIVWINEKLKKETSLSGCRTTKRVGFKRKYPFGK